MRGADPCEDETSAQVRFYVAVFRRVGRGELLVSYSSLEALRDNLGLLPLRDDESITVYGLGTLDAAGVEVDPFEWRMG